MKFELKTENENYSKSFSQVFITVFIFAILIISSDIALKLGAISKYYQIDHDCRVLSIEKSTSNFKRLTRVSNLKSKKNIWEFCREFLK